MISVLRIGHRKARDKRITTHVCLVARAFGADKIYIDNQDKKIEENIHSVVDRFGGNFDIKTGVNSKKIIKKWKGIIVHLTMYGAALEKITTEIKQNDDILIVIGAEKVPGWIYGEADYNVSVGNQPHSEVAALAMFLDRLTEGKWIKKSFKNPEIKIVPSNNGKKVVKQQK
ncbi:MAG: tRNA (cytidine(56)-2'-O)-methyltransferase [Candidatus Thermoplasmatota archaeon]